MTIPIRNLYFMFCYAWTRFPPGDGQAVGRDECPDLPNLFAKLLIAGLHKLIRRGLGRGYVDEVEETRSPRGRLLLDDMIKRQTLLRGYAVCGFDELQSDILINQILKATARLLRQHETLTKEFRDELSGMIRRLEHITDIRLTLGVFRCARASRNDRQYAMLLRLCEFVAKSQMPDQNGTSSKFSDILRDEVTMSTVFEEFLRNFYAHEQSEYRVKRDLMSWAAQPLSEGAERLLPLMETDISLSSPKRNIIIDAKYYRDPLAGRPGMPRKLRSAHLYQLHTYLHHVRLREPGRQVDGALIYPASGTALDADYLISNHGVRVFAVDLAKEWPEIHVDLLNVIERPFQQVPIAPTLSIEVGAI